MQEIKVAIKRDNVAKPGELEIGIYWNGKEKKRLEDLGKDNLSILGITEN